MIWQLMVETLAGPEMFGVFPHWLHCELVRAMLALPAECVASPVSGGAGS